MDINLGHEWDEILKTPKCKWCKVSSASRAAKEPCPKSPWTKISEVPKEVKQDPMSLEDFIWLLPPMPLDKRRRIIDEYSRCIDSFKQERKEPKRAEIVELTRQLNVALEDNHQLRDERLTHMGKVETMRTEISQLKDRLDNPQNYGLFNNQLADKVRDLQDEIKFLKSKPLPEWVEPLVKACGTFLNKMQEIEDSAEYRNVWVTAHVHLGPYSGKNWEQELKALKNVVEVAKKAQS